MKGKLILLIVFLCLWLPMVAFTQGSLSFDPPLKNAKTYGPLVWKLENKDIFFRVFPPHFRFMLYGRMAQSGRTQTVAVETDFFRWMSLLTRRQMEPGPLYVTDLRARPYVTAWDIEHDANLDVKLGFARVNWTFFPWAGLTALLPLLFWFWMSADASQVLSPRERFERDEQFRQKVRDLEIDYKDRAAALRRRTVMLAFLGYGVLFGSILLMLLVAAGLAIVAVTLTQTGGLAAVLFIVPAAFAFKLGKSLLSPAGGDMGVQLQLKDAPQLFAMLERIRKTTGGPPFERVFISHIMNASVSRHTGRLGIFGFGPVTLTLGLPLMQALSVEQVEAVIGHEYGHVAARDNALGQWVYRIRNSWLKLGDQLKAEQMWYVLRLNRFYAWFIGSFSPYSFTLSRSCEYEADAFAAKVVGQKHVADALVAVNIAGDELEGAFWAQVWKQARVSPEPAGRAFHAIASYFREPRDRREALGLMAKEEASFNSTHPATVQRVEALGQELSLPPPLGSSGAARLLGPLENALVAMFDKAWAEWNRSEWRKRFAEYQMSARKCEALQARGVARLNRDELYELVSAASVLEDDQLVMAACKEIIAREPQNAAAYVNLLGLRLVADNDESALYKMEDLLRDKPFYTDTACRFVLRYLYKHNRTEEAKVWRFRLDEWNYHQEAAREERSLIFASDDFAPPNIQHEFIRKIRDHFSPHKCVGRVYMAIKRVKYLPEQVMVVVGVMPNRWQFRSARKRDEELARVIASSPLKGQFHYFLIDKVAGLETRLKKIEGALVFKR
ncbi:MAG: M48 family metalloprotease [Alphaproteobacteria bacterium]